MVKKSVAYLGGKHGWTVVLAATLMRNVELERSFLSLDLLVGRGFDGDGGQRSFWNTGEIIEIQIIGGNFAEAGSSWGDTTVIKPIGRKALRIVYTIRLFIARFEHRHDIFEFIIAQICPPSATIR